MIYKSDGSMSFQPRRARDDEIKNAQKAKEEQLVQDTLILQKVNKAQREAFKEKFPNQLEHCMRLTAERLQAILTDKPKDLTDISTWTGSPKDIHELSASLYYLAQIKQQLPFFE